MHVYCAVGIAYQTGSLTAIDCKWASIGQLMIVQIGQDIIPPTLLDILQCTILWHFNLIFNICRTGFIQASLSKIQGLYKDF